MLFCCFSTVILTASHNCADINCFEMIDLLVLMLFLAVSCIITVLFDAVGCKNPLAVKPFWIGYVVNCDQRQKISLLN